jgi:nucleotide-binding universal stress UspA family protein
MQNQKFILSCISGMPPSHGVCDYAVWLSQTTNQKLKLLHTILPIDKKTKSNLSGSIGLGARAELLKELVEKEHLENKKRQQKGKEVLSRFITRAKDLGVSNLETCLRKGRLIETLMDFEEETAITVIGRFGNNHQGDKSIGSIGHHVEKIIKSIDTPIFVTGSDFIEPKNAMFAYDGSYAAKKALNFIVNSQIFTKVHLNVVNVGEQKYKSEAILEEAKKILVAANLNSTCTALTGKPEAALQEYADENDIDLVVMGAYGNNTIRNLLFGSFTNKMLSMCKRPTLLIR